jgi:hypothetical protein
MSDIYAENHQNDPVHTRQDDINDILVALKHADKNGFDGMPEAYAALDRIKYEPSATLAHDCGFNAGVLTEQYRRDGLIKLAIKELNEMIVGGDECEGRDSQLSHIIGILEHDPNHVWLARKSA